jgi:tRNA G26 N,N-dimethylase Trm1
MRYLAQVARDGGRGFDPLVAYVLDHHIRVYALISSRPRELPVDVMGGAGYLGPPLAGDGPFGPMWVGPLFDRSFLRDLRAPPSASRPKELGTLLERFLEESEVDAPFYFEPNLVARDAGVSRPPSIRLFLEALRKEGYRAGRTHVRASAFRTDAPRAAVLEVARRLSDLA